MKYRRMQVAAAILAAGLLATAGLTGVSAHDPRHGGTGPGIPGSSARPLPTGWVWPSGLPNHQKSPAPSKSSDPSKAPKPQHSTPPVLCGPVVTPTASPTPGNAAGDGLPAERRRWAVAAIFILRDINKRGNEA